MKFLVEQGVGVNANSGWPIISAARNGHLDVVKFLLEKGAHINNNAIWLAGEQGHHEIRQLLEETRANLINN